MTPAPQARRHKRHRGPDPGRPVHRPSEADPDDAGLAAARDRLDDLFESLEHVELQIVVVDPPDDRRLDARDRAKTAAIVGGRHALFDEATAAARQVALKGYARGGFTGTWAFTDMAISVATADDRLAAAAALEEAAMAAVVEDLVDAETVRILRSTADSLASMTGLPTPGSLANVASGRGWIRGPVGIVVVAFLILVVLGIANATVSRP